MFNRSFVHFLVKWCLSSFLAELYSLSSSIFFVSSGLQNFAKMHPVGFEPTHLSIAELKSAPLDHSGTNALHLSLRESVAIINMGFVLIHRVIKLFINYNKIELKHIFFRLVVNVYNM